LSSSYASDARSAASAAPYAASSALYNFFSGLLFSSAANIAITAVTNRVIPIIIKEIQPQAA
jgi:hypothetical protein